MTLLTVEDLRKWPEFADVDADVLTILLEAEEAEINRELGGPVSASVTEVIDGRQLTMVTLRRRAGSVTSVITDWDQVLTTLAADDYRIQHDRRTILRIGTGTNPGYAWPLVTVEYVPEDDTAIRKRVQKDLIALDLTYSPGATSEQIGAWMEQQQKSSVWNAAKEREAILSTLWDIEWPDFA